MDGSGEPQRYPTCGQGRDMSVIMDGNVAYVKYQTDGRNDYDYGETGFYATFNAEGLS